MSNNEYFYVSALKSAKETIEEQEKEIQRLRSLLGSKTSIGAKSYGSDAELPETD